MSHARTILRRKDVLGKATPVAAPIYVDSDDNKLKMIPAGSGTTEVDIVDVSSTQTLTNKTLTTPTTTANVQSVAAAGTGQSDAGAITAATPGMILGTGADGTKGIVLPAATAGKRYGIKNRDSDNAVLKVYPAGTDTINAIAASSAISMGAKTSAEFMCVVAGAWLTIPLLPS